MNKDLTTLIGKTIAAIDWIPVQYTKEDWDKDGVPDDGDWLKITFTDKTEFILRGSYSEDWTGNSLNEYPAYLGVKIIEHK